MLKWPRRKGSTECSLAWLCLMPTVKRSKLLELNWGFFGEKEQDIKKNTQSSWLVQGTNTRDNFNVKISFMMTRLRGLITSLKSISEKMENHRSYNIGKKKRLKKIVLASQFLWGEALILCCPCRIHLRSTTKSKCILN